MASAKVDARATLGSHVDETRGGMTSNVRNRQITSVCALAECERPGRRKPVLARRTGVPPGTRRCCGADEETAARAHLHKYQRLVLLSPAAYMSTW